MLQENIIKALNDQINKEFYSAYLYLAMAAQAEAMSLPGMGNWFRIQAQEELGHAMKIFRYVIEHGARVELEAVAKPPTTYESPLAMFEETLKHERTITQRIHSLVDQAIKAGDHATHSFLKWFVDEQVEEESNVATIVARLKMAQGPGALLFVDHQLGKRSAEAK